MAIYASGEDYLETILLLGKEGQDVHSVEVARKMGVSKPTVTKAVKHLVQEEYVEMDGVHLRLTDKGRARAEAIYQKHTVLAKFWTLLGVSAQTAEEDACRMEHGISDEVFEAARKFVLENSEK